MSALDLSFDLITLVWQYDAMWVATACYGNCADSCQDALDALDQAGTRRLICMASAHHIIHGTKTQKRHGAFHKMSKPESFSLQAT